MKKTILSIFILSLVLLSISFSSALCLNCNQQNPQVRYYQNANGCSIYSPSTYYQHYNVKPTYSINQPYQYSQIRYHQELKQPDSPSKKEENKCNWHMLFYRRC
jgi:hypothetical protein